MSTEGAKRVDYGAHVWLRDADNPGSTWVMYYVTRFPNSDERCLGPEDVLTQSILGACTHETRVYPRPSDGRKVRVELCEIHPGTDKPARSRTKLRPTRATATATPTSTSTLTARAPATSTKRATAAARKADALAQVGASISDEAQQDQALRFRLFGCRRRTLQAVSPDDVSKLHACALELAGILAEYQDTAVPRMNVRTRSWVIDTVTFASRGFGAPDQAESRSAWLHKIGRMVPGL